MTQNTLQNKVKSKKQYSKNKKMHKMLKITCLIKNKKIYL